MARKAEWRPKTSTQWDALPMRGREAWLADLTDAQLLRQAAVRAQASGGAVPAVLRAWVVNGLIGRERAQRLIAQVEQAAP